MLFEVTHQWGTIPNFLVLTGVLTVIGIYLREYEPPIKAQNIALMLLSFGAMLGHFLVASPYAGFLMAGMVFYKDKLVMEAQLVASSYKGLKNSLTQDNTSNVDSTDKSSK